MNKTLVQELKGAVKAMNKVLKENEEPLIKVVGAKRDTIMEKFFEVISSYVEDKRTAEIPDAAIDFYNKVVEEADEGGEAEQTEKKTRKQSTAKAKANKPAGKKKTTGKKKSSESAVALAVDAYMNKGLTKTADIVAEIEDNFPGRNIKSVVSTVVCVLGHVNK